MTNEPGKPEPGRATATETWAALTADAEAQLVDVRTAPEWTYVGLPDLSALGRTVHRVSWQTWPGPTANPGFVEELRAAGLRPGQPLYFLCRSGARSLNAARAALAAGFGPCINVTDGFEGRKDAAGHRRTVEGWCVAGLPWSQG